MTRRLAQQAPVQVGSLLLAWYRKGHRNLPWRNTRDPYRIWISEIMLQQTRAQAVIPYYERFLTRFPDVQSLAAAREDDVLALWSGLGYYSRARNLHRAAESIVAAGDGMPRDYAAIRALPGIGDYTAAAIASIAFDLPHAVLDGNVLRVVARIENDAADIASARTKDRFRKVAQVWLEEGGTVPAGRVSGGKNPGRIVGQALPPANCDLGALAGGLAGESACPTLSGQVPGESASQPGHAGQFNQALMELGATVCLPRQPLCLLCPVASLCRAREQGTAAQLPVKLRKTEPVQLEGVLLVVRNRGRVLLRQRDRLSSRMPGFWDLPTPEELPGAEIGERIGAIRHTITHHHYALEVRHASSKAPRDAAFRWFTAAEMSAIPFSTTARKALYLAGFVPKL